MHEPATPPPRVMTIGGSDSGGGSGVQADLKTFAALATYGTSVLTAVIAQNTREIAAIAEVPEEVVIAQIDTVAEDIGARAVKTGMLGNRRVIQNAVDRLEAWGIPHLVVDPVMVSRSGLPLLASDALAPLRDELLPLATVVTANLYEASALTEIEVTSRSRVERVARALQQLGPSVVVIEGGEPEDLASDLVMDGDTIEWLENRPGATPTAHGDGGTFSAAITALLAHGCEPGEAVRLARLYVANAVDRAYRVGEGLAPVNHFAPLPPAVADRIGQRTRT